MKSLYNIINELHNKTRNELTLRGLKLATAESCTGGWVAKLMTDIAGSSDYFEASVVSYSNASKHSLLGVPGSIIEKYGAVSEATVLSMVEGLFDRTAADVAVSVSGIAGPGGGSDEKPVGTVWLCWALRDTPPVARVYHFGGDREAVRQQSVCAVFEGVLALLAGD